MMWSWDDFAQKLRRLGRRNANGKNYRVAAWFDDGELLQGSFAYDGRLVTEVSLASYRSGRRVCTYATSHYWSDDDFGSFHWSLRGARGTLMLELSDMLGAPVIDIHDCSYEVHAEVRRRIVRGSITMLPATNPGDRQGRGSAADAGSGLSLEFAAG